MTWRGADMLDPEGPTFRFARVLVRVGLIVAALCAVGVILFADSLEHQESANPPAVDGVVVVTGGADRIQDGLALLKAGTGRRLLISGVSTSAPLEILKRRHLGHEAAFECCVDLDFQARNTYENAVETRRWVALHGFRSILLVTANYHMPRTRLEFEAAMPNVAIHPHPVVPEGARMERWWSQPGLVRIIALEFFKYWAASLRITLGVSGG